MQEIPLKPNQTLESITIDSAQSVVSFTISEEGKKKVVPIKKLFKITAKEFKVMEGYVEPKRVIAYAPEIGRQRYYRQTDGDIDKGLNVLTFKSKVYAESVARYLSQHWKEEWIVEEITL